MINSEILIDDKKHPLFNTDTYSEEFILNLLLVRYKFKDGYRVAQYPEKDGVSIKVWLDNFGYCGQEVGVFNLLEKVLKNED